MKFLRNKLKSSIRNYLLILEQDLEIALQKKATAETCEYIVHNMSVCKSFSSRNEIYDFVTTDFSFPDRAFFLEFGVFKGESVNYMSKNLKTQMFHGFDSFEGLPEFWRDGFDKAAFDLNGGLPKVEENVRLYKGWFENTIPLFLEINNVIKIDLLHVDCDLYSSTKTIFDLLGHLINTGSIIIFDEYFNYPGWQSHEFKAFQEFIENKKLKYQYIAYNSKHEQVVVKIL